MQLICLFGDEQEGWSSSSYEQEFLSLNHVFAFLEFEHPKLFTLFSEKKYSVVLQKTKESEPFVWELGTGFETFDFEYVFLIEKVEGNAFFTASAVTIAAALAGSLSAIAFVAAVTIANALIALALAYGIGQIMQALSPNKTSNSTPTKNLTFNQVPNLDSQGTYIPYNLGDYLCGGIIIGRKVDTYAITITENSEDPAFPKTFNTIPKADLATAVQGAWYKITAD